MSLSDALSICHSFLCTPGLRLSLATEDYSAHIGDRWKGGLTLPESIPPGINVEIWWINSLAPSLFAWGHSEGCALQCLPEVPRGIGILLSPVEILLIVFFLFSAIPVSFHHFPSSVSWGHLPNKVLALGSVSQCLLLGELNQSQWGKARARTTITLTDSLGKSGQTLVERA